MHEILRKVLIFCKDCIWRFLPDVALAYMSLQMWIKDCKSCGIFEQRKFFVGSSAAKTLCDTSIEPQIHGVSRHNTAVLATFFHDSSKKKAV
jgi:hypothetical protein